MELAGLGLKIGDRVLLMELCDKAVKSKFGVRLVPGTVLFIIQAPPEFKRHSGPLAIWIHINVPRSLEWNYFFESLELQQVQ